MSVLLFVRRPKVQEIKLTQANNGESYELHRDGIIVIRLTEIPSTGYCWEIEELDNKILALQRSDFFLPEDPQIGEGGVRVFAFKAKAAGSAHIRLKHWREWEGNDSIIDVFDVTTVVKN